jgi:hypothetical protein
VSAEGHLEVFRAGRVRHALFTLFAVGMVVGGIFMARDQQGWVAYAVIAFGVLMALVFAVQLLPGAASLDIGPAGLRYSSMYRRQDLAWREVEGFYVIFLSGNKFVGWNYIAGHPKKGRGTEVAKALGGAEGMLPLCYGLKPQALADKLNACLARDRADPTHG